MFYQTEQSVSLNRTVCFIKGNTLFPLKEHFVSTYKNTLFSVAKQSVSAL